MPYFNWKNHQLYFREQGEGNLLMILPGDTASSACHQGELDHFGDRFQTVSLDFLGTGKSDRVAKWADNWWQEGARQAKALVDHLGYQKCIVMGTSGGASAALLMAIEYSDTVSAVVADSCVELFSMEFVEKTVIVNRRVRTSGQIQFWEFANGADWDQVVEADTAMLVRFAKQGGDWFSGRLSKIQCPVLITANKEDRDLPQIVLQTSRMAEQVRNCRLFINDHGGHPMMWTAPQDFHAVVDHFLKPLDH
jgi:valacyclovir hydrolase